MTLTPRPARPPSLQHSLDVFHAVYMQHYDELLNVVRHLALSSYGRYPNDLPSDLAQEVFLSVQHNISQGNARFDTVAAAKGYIKMALRNAFFDHARRLSNRNISLSTPGLTETIATGHSFDASSRAALLAQSVERLFENGVLDRNSRAALMWIRHQQGASLHEIAQAFSVKPGNAATSISRFIDRIADALGESDARRRTKKNRSKQ